MSRGALALLIRGGTQNWSAERWKARFDKVCGDRRVLQGAEATADPKDVHYAAVWKPVPGELAAFPNLKVIFNLGPGVDAVMADQSLPNVPLGRVALGDLTGRITDFPLHPLLTPHRHGPYLLPSHPHPRLT